MQLYLTGIFLFLIGINPVIALADDFGDYSKFIKTNYYLLDNQQFSKIKCTIRAPILDTVLTNTRRQLQTLPGKIIIEGNAEDFFLIYDKNQELTFIEPHFHIKALEPGSSSNQQSLDQDIQDLRKGLNSVEQIISGIFGQYTLSGNKKIKSFLNTETGTQMTVENDGIISKEIYSGLSRTRGIKWWRGHDGN